MPYKSEKQRRYMNWAANEGKISKGVVDEFNQASKGMKLPETADQNYGSHRYSHILKNKKG